MTSKIATGGSGRAEGLNTAGPIQDKLPSRMRKSGTGGRTERVCYTREVSSQLTLDTSWVFLKRGQPGKQARGTGRGSAR